MRLPVIRNDRARRPGPYARGEGSLESPARIVQYLAFSEVVEKRAYDRHELAQNPGPVFGRIAIPASRPRFDFRAMSRARLFSVQPNIVLSLLFARRHSLRSRYRELR